MTEIKHLNAINSLLDLIKLNETEVEELYQLIGDTGIDIIMHHLHDFEKTMSKDTDELGLLEWLKRLFQKSPITYELLQKTIRENKQLFDKIQEIFIKKLL